VDKSVENRVTNFPSAYPYWLSVKLAVFSPKKNFFIFQ